ncbi:hypothetical protein Pedsa_0257 [Pseudopedobacter saltans DSM 12145]|uniref:DUF5683 domain-containing protein n=1 Tax=Pseudopedobacter saltans (strain ATCC 51119 / DSM 12145 / JCM 21818 / CCUG 39354 / LMG 10337 / NBRC 100064 / NCIMB 13643) TaxID=762903 RepID=F0SEH7_PSESL|nr:DUF5683 domain-containing protein [Pseudopedobacter saltans]ADY50842.1 hypothetical protein Pedsa_0257 [Pseudopedobacter saltans DSM 12145]
MIKYAFSIILLLGLVLNVKGQELDSLSKQIIKEGSDVGPAIKERGNTLFRDSSSLQSPRKAVLRSAIIPGWGQIRNKKWWKVPLVYGGYVGVGLYYEFNQRYYKEFLSESQARKRGEFKYEKYQFATDEQIYNTKDFYRRNRDLAIIAFFAFHSLQMIDAYIDAKLATFDVSDNLSINLKPSIYTPMYAGSGFQAPVPMLKLNIKL